LGDTANVEKGERVAVTELDDVKKDLLLPRVPERIDIGRPVDRKISGAQTPVATATSQEYQY